MSKKIILGGGEWHKFRDFTGVGTSPQDLDFVDHLTAIDDAVPKRVKGAAPEREDE